MQPDESMSPVEPEREEDIRRIAGAMAKMRLLIGRRYIGRLAISRVGAGIELSHLDVLGLVKRLSHTQDVTVGSVADHLRIDHSRASRIVAELVKNGVLRRQASQEDARRTIVTLTRKGADLRAQLESVKFEVLSQVLSDWRPDEVAAFAELYNRFTEKLQQQATAFETENDA
jgi:DNA-binding MarR family transcriptional regulator